jgi:protein TonB
MFENLIESKKKKQKSFTQSVVSVIVHGVIIFGAVQATRGAAEQLKEVLQDTTMVFLEPPKAPPPPEQPPPEAVIAANPPPQGFQVVTPPDNIPTEIPPVNLNERFDPKDFTGKGVEGGIGTGIAGGTGPVPTVAGEVFLAAEVDDPPQAQTAGGVCEPQFPAVMKAAGINGKVIMQFVVNTDGRVDQGSMKIMSSTHKAFEDPAKQAMFKCPFKPGRSRGSPVRVLVQQAISFNLQ